MTDVNWGSRDALSIVRALNGGAGPQPPSAAATAWKTMQQALVDADTEFKTALGNAQAGWQGEAADAAIERMSPFGKWALMAGKQSTVLSSGAEDYGTAFTGTRNTVPSEMEVMTARNNQLFSHAIATAGPPNPATMANAEVADAVVAEQNAQAQAAMAGYDAVVVASTKPVEFPPAPQMTAGTGGNTGGPGGGGITYDGIGGGAVSDYSATTSSASTGTVSQTGNGSGGQVSQGTQQYQGGQPGTTGGATAGPGAGTGSAGYSPITGGAGVSGGAGTTAAGSARGGSSMNPISGGAATGAGAGSAGSRRSGAGTAGAFGAGAAGGVAGGVGAGGSGSGGGAGGYGGSGGSSGESAGRSGLGGRPGVGGSGPLNGAGTSEGVAGRGSGVAGGGRGAGGPMGGGAGRGQGQDDDEHQTPDYLKDFEHFEDGRVVAPPVIGADPQY